MGMRKALNMSLGIVLLIVFYSAIFMALMLLEGQDQNAHPFTALYWVIVTITTLGYGDIVFHSQLGRFFSILVALSGVAILWAVIMPLMITPRMESLVRASPDSAPEKIHDHVIISGYSPMVETLTERLELLKIPFIIIERSEEVARSIYRKYPTLYGDPSEKEVLNRANIQSARLFIANEKDELDAEVLLSLRKISNIETIELVNDLNSSRFLCYAGASRIISPKTLLGTFIAQIASPPRKLVFPGAVHLFGELTLAELPIYPGSELIGQNLTMEGVRQTGASIVGLWQRGEFLPQPGADEAIQSNSVIMAVGNMEQLTRLRDLTLGTQKAGPLLILGYGDVGVRVARVLQERGIEPVIVDRRDLGDIPFAHFRGEAASEAVLIAAGIKDAVGTMVLLNNDSDVIYCTLLARNLNADAFVVARANRVKSVENIYRAGADYVASVPIVASHMLAKIIQKEEEELGLLYEDLELKLFNVDKRSRLAGATLEEIDLPGRFGCRIAALERRGQATAALDQDTVVERGDTLAVIGSPEGIEAFSEACDRRPTWKRMLKILRRFPALKV